MNQQDYNTLRGEGLSGALNDMKRLAFLTNGATVPTLNDATREYLAQQGFTGSIQDQWIAYLRTLGYTGSINDVLTASDVFGTIGVVNFTTWNPSDKSANILLSGGDLVATSNLASWKSVRAIDGKATGKYYFELTFSDANHYILGISDSVGTLLSTYVGAVANSIGIRIETGVWFSSGFTGNSAPPSGPGTYSFAVDVDSRKAWVRKNGGAWTNGGDPAAGTLPSITWVPALTIYPAASVYHVGAALTANFGQSSFAYSPPSGFTAGWPSN